MCFYALTRERVLCLRRQTFKPGQLRAATTDFGGAGQAPRQWTPDTKALALAALFTYEVYPRASLYSDSYVTSSVYKAARTRDNQWIVFQHHTRWCAALLVKPEFMTA